MVDTIFGAIVAFAVFLLVGNTAIIGCAAIAEFAPATQFAQSLSEFAKLILPGS